MAGSETPEAPASRATEAAPGRKIDSWRRVVRRVDSLRRDATARRGSAEPYATVSVDRNDSLATICGKLDSARMIRVALLVQDGNRDLSRAISMRLLMRHAQLTGKDILLVSRSQSIRRRADAEGQACVGSERHIAFEDGQSASLPLGGLNLGPLHGLVLPALAMVVILIGAFGALFWYLPVARITLYPATEAVSADQMVMVDDQASQLNQNGFIVPAQRRQIKAQRAVFIPASGAPPDDPASGSHTIAAADLDAGQSLAAAAIREQGLSDLRSRYSDETFFPETVQSDISDVSPAQKAGDTADFLEMRYTGNVSALSASNSDLRRLFIGLLQKNLSSDRQILDQSLVVTVVKTDAFDSANGRLPVEFRVTAGSTAVLDTASIAARLRGRNRSAALALVDSIAAGTQPATLALTPRWAPWLPRVASHIHLQLQAGLPP